MRMTLDDYDDDDVCVCAWRMTLDDYHDDDDDDECMYVHGGWL